MSDSLRYRVVRCTRCQSVYPHRRNVCSACGSAERVGSLASFEEVERTRVLHRVGRKQVVLPKGAAVHPQAAPGGIWRALIPRAVTRAPELMGMLRRR